MGNDVLGREVPLVFSGILYYCTCISLVFCGIYKCVSKVLESMHDALDSCISPMPGLFVFHIKRVVFACECARARIGRVSACEHVALVHSCIYVRTLVSVRVSE